MQVVDYYLARKDVLLLDFDDEARCWKPILTSHYGIDEAEGILDECRGQFELLIPQVPYIGGDENKLTSSLMDATRCLTLFLTMRDYGRTAAETGKILFEAILARESEMPRSSSPSDVHSRANIMLSRRERAEISLERRYPEDYVYSFVTGDGQAFDYGYNFYECAAQKFYRRQGAEVFMPFYCALDFAWSQVLGLGLSREMTLSEGHALCNHRFKPVKVGRSDTPTGGGRNAIPSEDDGG
jgi:hypothetical protein